LRDRFNASSVFHAARESSVFDGLLDGTDYRLEYLILIFFNVKGKPLFVGRPRVE
jgi:hypothetical protein